MEHSVWRAQDGTVDFFWQLSNGASSTETIEALRTAGFGTKTVEAEYIDNPSALSEISPLVAERFSGSAPGASGSINFEFNNKPGSDIGVSPGGISSVMFLDTSATEFTSDGFFDVISDGYQLSSSSVGFAPPVPVPAAFYLLGSGILGLVGMGMIKHRKTL